MEFQAIKVMPLMLLMLLLQQAVYINGMDHLFNLIFLISTKTLLYYTAFLSMFLMFVKIGSPYKL